MIRKLAVAAMIAAAIALLAALVYQSRPLDMATHVGHQEALSDLARIRDDLGSLTAQLRAARAPGQVPPASAETLVGRIERTVGELPHASSGLDDPRLLAAERDVVETAGATVVEAEVLIGSAGAFGAAMSRLRDDGPRVVQELRDTGQTRTATRLFELLVATLDYGKQSAGTGGAPGDELQRALASLTRDARVDSAVAGRLTPLLDAARTVLSTRDTVDAGLASLAASPLRAAAGEASELRTALYQARFTSIDRARLMLSVYAVLLLLGAGFIAWRLHHSYREINEINAELEAVNAGLEERVAARTAELEAAMRELKESQVQLVQAEKMSSLGQLVAGISHEINTPLLYLTNNAALIQERLATLTEFVERCSAAFAMRPADDEDRNDFQQRFVKALKQARVYLTQNQIEDDLLEAQSLIEDSIQGLGDLTQMAQGLKDFSRLDRAPIDSFDINQGLDRTLLIARNALKYKVEIHREYGELPPVECSPSQINQVFLNLITNAAQAIEDHGEIRLRTELLEDGRVAVHVADTGCGIEPDVLERIRDPFFTTKPVGEGTGLGLSIVDQIVTGHGGELLIESTPGQGSTFTVVLPAKQPRKAPADAFDDEDEEPGFLNEEFSLDETDLDDPSLAEAS